MERPLAIYGALNLSRRAILPPSRLFIWCDTLTFVLPVEGVAIGFSVGLEMARIAYRWRFFEALGVFRCACACGCWPEREMYLTGFRSDWKLTEGDDQAPHGRPGCARRAWVTPHDRERLTYYALRVDVADARLAHPGLPSRAEGYAVSRRSRTRLRRRSIHRTGHRRRCSVKIIAAEVIAAEVAKVAPEPRPRAATTESSLRRPPCKWRRPRSDWEAS